MMCLYVQMVLFIAVGFDLQKPAEPNKVGDIVHHFSSKSLGRGLLKGFEEHAQEIVHTIQDQHIRHTKAAEKQETNRPGRWRAGAGRDTWKAGDGERGLGKPDSM